jgi:hypothetical protein
MVIRAMETDGSKWVDAETFDEVLAALKMFYPNSGCPVCGGDCAGANPPVLYCPMRIAGAALAKAMQETL